MNFLQRLFGTNNEELLKKIDLLIAQNNNKNNPEINDELSTKLDKILLMKQNPQQNATDPVLHEVEIIKAFRLENESGLALDFDQVSTGVFSGTWKPISSKSHNSELHSILSGISGVGVTSGLSTMATQGLFKATAPVRELLKLSSGGFSSMVGNASGGGITRHAGFVSAGSQIFTPLIVFQIASMVTGQYYMNNITKQLNAVQEKLDEMLMLFHIERKAKLRKAFFFIKKFSESTSFEIEDYVMMKQVISELVDIREEYSMMLSNIVEEFTAKNFKSNYSSIKEAEMVQLDFDKSGYVDKMRMSIKADELYHLAKIVELHMNLMYKNPEINRLNKIQDMFNEIQKFEPNELMYVKTAELHHALKQKIDSQLLASIKSSTFTADKIIEMRSRFISEFARLDLETGESFKIIKQRQMDISNPFNKEQEILLDNRNGEAILYVK